MRSDWSKTHILSENRLRNKRVFYFFFVTLALLGSCFLHFPGVFKCPSCFITRPLCLLKAGVNPKISRIGRQKQKNNFFSFFTKRTHLVNYFRKWHQKVRFPFLFFKMCKTWKFGHRAFSGGHEAWKLAHVQYARMDAPNVVLTCPLHSLWGVS